LRRLEGEHDARRREDRGEASRGAQRPQDLEAAPLQLQQGLESARRVGGTAKVRQPRTDFVVCLVYGVEGPGERHGALRADETRVAVGTRLRTAYRRAVDHDDASPGGAQIV